MVFRRFVDSLTEPKVAALLVLLTLAVFGPAAIQNGFVSLDDNYLIYENAAVKTITLPHIAHVFTTYDPQLYIPLTFVSYQINAALFGMSAASFHIINLLLHCANVVLVLLIIRRLTGKLFVAGIAALLFAIHPLQTEAVMWAASRKDLLSGLFFLSSTLEYLRYQETWYRRHLIGSIVLFALGLLSKVSIILLPAWLLCIDWLQGRNTGRQALTEKIPYGALATLFGVIAVVGKAKVLSSSGTLLNMLLPAKSSVFYLQKMIWPSGLSVVYPYIPGQQSLLADFGPTIAVLLVLLAALVWLFFKNRHRIVVFCLGTYFLLLAPSFSTFWKNGFLYFASDRYAYLASIGIFMLAGLVLSRLLEKQSKDIAVPVAAVIVALLIVPFTVAQSTVWKSSISMYENVLRFYPDSVMAQTNLGLELQNSGDRAGARLHYERAIELDPHSTNAYFNLASLNQEEGKEAERQKLFVDIVDAFTDRQVQSAADVRAFVWLIAKLDELGKNEDSLRLAEKLAKIGTQFPDARHALGEKYRLLGRDAEAQMEFEAAAKTGSKNPHTYYYLAEYYSNMNNLPKTIDVLKKGVALDPTNLAARQQLLELQR